MAEIDDALPNNPPSDSEFVEQEVVSGIEAPERNVNLLMK
jgi:hypothetical protein